MTTLPPDLLLRCLAESRSALPLVRNAAGLDALAADIASGRIQASLDSPNSKWAKARLDHIRPLLTANGQALLGAVDVFVVSHLYHNASALLWNERRTIVIYRGLLDVLLYFTSLNHFAYNLPTPLDEIFPFSRLPSMSARAATLTLLQLLITHFVRDLMAMPPIFRLLNEDQQRTVINVIDGALLFIVCHELGHFELDHLSLEAKPTRTVIGDLVYAEVLSEFQLQEVDADEFAMGLYEPALRGLVPGAIMAAFAPLAFFEPLLQIKSGSHPFSINRMNNISRLGADQAAALDMRDLRDHFASMASSIDRITPYLQVTRDLGLDPFQAGLGRLDVLAALEKLVPILLDHGVDIREALAAVPQMPHEARYPIGLFD